MAAALRWAGSSAATRAVLGRSGPRLQIHKVPPPGLAIEYKVANKLSVDGNATRLEQEHKPERDVINKDRGRMFVLKLSTCSGSCDSV